MDERACCEMPKYRCHKEVHAVEIEKITYSKHYAMIYPDSRFAAIRVDAEYVRKHNPQAGGYYVVYKDGYESWSPKEAFEDGYTKLS